MSEPSLWSFIVDAGPIVKVVMLILMTASIASWTIIIQRAKLLQKTRREVDSFEERFWSGVDLTQLYQQLASRPEELNGLSGIFYAGFHEFTRLKRQVGINPAAIMEGVQRAMRIAQARDVDNLEKHLSFLATVGSTSPYVGLFGTVWGIMTAFRSLGTVQQATISMVAPGISEALIATAIGLFAAIPAVIAYNYFANELERLTNSYDTFQQEFSNVLHRQAHS
jgi:biopolymer transport protein TolQ